MAGILLTGGASRRMGFDKASLSIEGSPNAARLASILRDVARPVVEVGPGRSGLRAVPDEAPGSGPLAALATGIRALSDEGFRGAALVRPRPTPAGRPAQ